MRKLVYYVAVSLDGFVSRENGDISDFSFKGEHVDDLLTYYPETIPTHMRSELAVDSENQQFDTILMGRNTYELGLRFGITNPYQHLNQFVFSKSLDKLPHSSIKLVNSNAISTVQELKQQNGMDIWLCGGPLLASNLITEIDRIILKINPFLMGNGKSLFAHDLIKTELEIVDRKDYSNGFSIVNYKLLKSV